MKERKGNSPLLHKITVPLQTLLDSLKSRELTLFVQACLRQDGLFLPTQFTATLFSVLSRSCSLSTNLNLNARLCVIAET